MQNGQQQPSAAFWVTLAVPVAWFGWLCGKCAAPGRKIGAWLAQLTDAMQTPWRVLPATKECWIGAGLALLVYSLCILLYLDGQGKRRPGEEHGSARWGNVKRVCAKYRYHPQKGSAENKSTAPKKYISYNIPLTQNVCIGLDVRRHLRNLNILVIGGSGAGKSRSFVKPGIMEGNCSFLVCDPAGELLRDCTPLLLDMGYDVKVFNLSDRARSNCYNPFRYLRSDTDVIQLITLLVRNTNGSGKSTSDPFWEKAEATLLIALILLIYHEAPEDEQNFSTLMYLINHAAASEEDEQKKNAVDELFDELAAEKPNHIACRFYQSYKLAAGKTAKSILIMAASRLAHFMMHDIAEITGTDEMDLSTLGDRKRAIFVVTPVNDKSFNYLVSMMYMQAFQQLYDHAERDCGGTLPEHVRFMMDEFANVPLPEDFENTLATCRKYNISCDIVLQNIAQLKGMYKDTWENIVGNCDTLLYLGGNEKGSHEYISHLLGKATIETQSTSQSKGGHGSFSKSTQQAGRELMTPDEVRMLDNRYALLFIRGEHPLKDMKYALTRHPLIARTADGNAAPYVHPARRMRSESAPTQSNTLEIEGQTFIFEDFLDMEENQLP